jgi:ubiquinone/menaquinone biosynthesis C-methylase UbiE
MAASCGVTPEAWKASIVRTFITANVKPSTVALEIGLGHGRWSIEIAPRVRQLIAVDLAQSCIEFCRKRLKDRTNVAYFVNDGKSLPEAATASIDFIFSFDTFVHIEEPETRSYAKEFARVLKRQALGVIHHAGNPTPAQRAKGCRSQVTAAQFAKILTENGLVVIRQTDSWDGGDVKMAADVVTVFVKP